MSRRLARNASELVSMLDWMTAISGHPARRRPLSPRGRGREATTYGCSRLHAPLARPLAKATVSRLAELVRGDCAARVTKRPSSAPSGHLLPKGRRDASALPPIAALSLLLQQLGGD